jgi:hypothetical protein
MSTGQNMVCFKGTGGDPPGVSPTRLTPALLNHG